MTSRLICLSVFSLVMLLALSISPAQADSVIFDQTNTGLPEGTLFQNVSVFSPVGQSFTPSFSSLNFVDLLTEESTDAAFVLEVAIRLDTISGTILGTSQPTVVNPSADLATVVIPFTFSTPVAVVPGQLYVIQDLEVSGQGLVGSSDINNYAGGTQILDGVAQPGNDLWFQEGIEIPEPGALLLLGTGLAGLLTIDFLKKLYIFCTG